MEGVPGVVGGGQAASAVGGRPRLGIPGSLSVLLAAGHSSLPLSSPLEVAVINTESTAYAIQYTYLGVYLGASVDIKTEITNRAALAPLKVRMLPSCNKELYCVAANQGHWLITV